MVKRIDSSFFKTAVDFLPDVAAFLDAAGNVQYLNEAAHVFVGKTPEQTIGRPLLEVAPPEIAQQLQQMYLAAVEHAAMQEAEISGSLLDGEPYTTMLQAVPVYEEGKLAQVVIISHDITGRIIAEKQCKDFLDRLKTLLNVSLDLLSVNELPPLLEGLATAAQRLADARIVMTCYRADDGQWLVGPCRPESASPAALPAQAFTEMSTSIIKDLLADAPTLRLTDEQLRNHPMWGVIPRRHMPLNGFLGARIVDGHGRTAGLITLSDKSSGDFTPEDETLIQHLGALASLAFQHIQAQNQLKERAEQAEEGQRKLESLTDALAKTAAELGRSNKDLEQFAYIASHDLQEPLRMISGFLNILRQQYQGQLDKNAGDCIAYAVEGANRTQKLITALLAYSRIGSHAEPFAPTNLEAVVDDVLTTFSLSLLDAEAVIKRDPLPTVVADETQLIQLYQNLIANSLKFRKPGKLKIHIGAKRENGQWLFWVRDNGIGFPQEHADRAFLIFQQLHPGHQYEGTGIGLAICKRVVERHAGKIWAESQPQKGTTFYFTLNT